jgi:hypothetical protein
MAIVILERDSLTSENVSVWILVVPWPAHLRSWTYVLRSKTNTDGVQKEQTDVHRPLPPTPCGYVPCVPLTWAALSGRPGVRACWQREATVRALPGTGGRPGPCCLLLFLLCVSCSTVPPTALSRIPWDVNTTKPHSRAAVPRRNWILVTVLYF